MKIHVGGLAAHIPSRYIQHLLGFLISVGRKVLFLFLLIKRAFYKNENKLVTNLTCLLYRPNYLFVL